MITPTHYVIPKSWLRVSAILLLLLVVGVTAVLSQQLVQPDRRINQVAHFGGDALYCVDRNFVATNQYADLGTGGFRLLNMSGQELWFVPADVITAALQQAKTTGAGVLVAEGHGTYGPTRIDTYVTAEGDIFVFSGYDEFGKLNSLEFRFCIPVGPIPNEPDEADAGPSLCSYDEVDALYGPAGGPGPEQDAYFECASRLCGGDFTELEAADDCICGSSIYDGVCKDS